MLHRCLPILFAAATLFNVGCKKDDPAPSDPTTQGQSAQQAAPLKLEAPEAVLAYGGTAPLKGALAQLDELVKATQQPLPPLEQMILPRVQSELRLKSTDALDLSRPLRVAIFDPKGADGAKLNDPLALLVGIKSADALTKDLPETGRKTDDEGNALSYVKFEGAEQPIYVNFVEGFAVFTRDAQLFKPNEAFFKQLAAAPISGVGTLTLQVDHLMARYGAQYERNIKRTQRQVKRISGTQISAEALDSYFEFLLNSPKQLDRVSFQLNAQAQGVALSLRLSPKAGSDLGKNFGLFQGKLDPSLLADYPKDTAALIAMNVSPEAFELFMKISENFLQFSPIFKKDGPMFATYQEAMKSYMQSMDGRMAMGAWPTEQGVQMGTTYGVTKAQGVRDALDALMKVNETPEGQAAYAEVGLELSIERDAYKVGEVSVSIQRTTFKGLEGRGGANPIEGMIMQAMSDLFTVHTGVGEKLTAMAFGDQSQKALEGLFGGTFKQGLEQTPAIKHAFASLAPNATFLMWINPISLARSVHLSGANPLSKALAKNEATSGLGLSIGGEGEQLIVTFDVPTQFLREVGAAVQAVMGSF